MIHVYRPIPNHQQILKFELESPNLEPSDPSSLPRRSSIVWISMLMSVVAIGSAVVALLMTRTALDNQVNIAESQAALMELKTTLQAQPVQTQPTSAAAQKQPSVLPRPTIRMVRESMDVSSESLEDELEQVVTSLQIQYPKLPDALHVVAMMKAQTRKYAEAQELWQQCTRLAPKQEMYYVNLASVAMEQGSDEFAAKTLQQALDQGLESFEISYHLGIAKSRLGAYEDAIQLTEKALKKYPTAASLWLILGQAQLELEKNQEAETSFRKALEFGASSPAVYVGLGNACVRQGKREEGTRFLKTYSELKSQDKLSGQERYQTLSVKEIKQTATTVFTEAATVYFRQKDTRQTERLLTRCIALEPTKPSGLRALADYYFKMKMLAEERLVRERIIEVGSDRFGDYIDVAKVCAQMGDRESAEANLKLAMALYPQAVEPYAALSQMQLESGRLESAKWYAQQSLERQPSAEGFRFLASICNQQQDALGEAEALRLAKQLEKKP